MLTKTMMMNEERNVLDDLLNNGDDEDFDAELKAPKSFDRSRLTTSNNKTNAITRNKLDSKKKSSIKQSSSATQIKDNGNKSVDTNIDNRSTENGNGRLKRSVSRESSCNSQYSCDSGSCSCEDHSSMADNVDHHASSQIEGSKNRNNNDDENDRASNADSDRSYQSFTRSPSLKIKITKNSNSRMVAKSNLHADEEDNDRDDHDILIGRKRKHANDDDNEIKRDRRQTSDHPHHHHHHRQRHHHHDSPRENKKKDSNIKKRDYTSLIKYFFKDSCYFVMKSNNEENVEISKREGVWSTPLPNEMKLNSAFLEFRNVILIFSVKESGKFQGFARLSSEAQYDLEPVKWILPPGVHSCPFGGIFFIDWICRNELSFTNTSHLYNAFNESKPVKIARDGQELEPKVGEELCRLFPPDDFVDLIPMLKRMKKQTLNRPRKRRPRGPFMDFDEGNGATVLRNDSYKNKTSSHHVSSLSSLHPIKKRYEYSDGYYSNRVREDRYNRIMPQPRTRTSDQHYGSLNGHHHANYRYPPSSDSYHSLDNGNHRYSSNMTASSSYSSNTNYFYQHHNRHQHQYSHQSHYRSQYSSVMDVRQQQVHRDHHHHHHHSRTSSYRDRY